MNAATETSESFAAPATAPRPVRPFYWSVRRELWENRSLFIAPLVAGGIALAGADRSSRCTLQLSKACRPCRRSTPETPADGDRDRLYAGIAHR